MNILVQLHPRAGNGAVLQTCVCSACRGRAPLRGGEGPRCLCPSTETEVSCHALHKHFSEPLPSCLYHGFHDRGLAPHIAQEASPVQGSEYTLLASAAPRLLCKTVPGMSPPCCRCHLFILALTKGNHASEKTLYWKGLNL